MALFSRDLGVDLGSTNVLIYAEGKGIVLREPAVVAVDKVNGKVLQVGSAARNMLGRTPGNVVAMRPLREGVITDYAMTEKMLAAFFQKIMRYALVKPRVIVCVPSGVTEVEERAVIQSAMEAVTAGRTTIMIAHRLSTVQNSDVIMVLDHGRIIERGSHDKLIEQKGTYYRLYTGAFELD